MDRPPLRPAGSPLVTIISPVFNQERYVAACVESALAQTYPYWEQVFVDDGSTDRTREIIAGYRDDRITLVSLPHRGLASLAESYNAALAVSRGELVGILEGDDLWPPSKLEHQVPLFADAATVLSWGRAALIDDAGATVGALTTAANVGARPHLATGDAFLRLTRTNFLIPSVTVMARRSALDAIGGFQQGGSSLYADLPTWLRLTAACPGRVTHADAVVGAYRVHATQTSRTKSAQMLREHWEVVEHLERTLAPDLLARAGWTARARQRAHARSLLATGELALANQDHAEALERFRGALPIAAGLDRAFALLGMACALARVDLLSAAHSLRARLLR